MAAKPVVPVMIRTEFGDVLESEAFRDAQTMQGDLTYTPGWSEMRRAHDQQLKEVADGTRSPSKVDPLPVRLHLARRATYSGQPDNRKTTQFVNNGYRAVTKDDIGQHDWLTAKPPTATIGPGGELHYGDTVLMVCDAKSAARNAAQIQIRTNQMLRETAAADFVKLGERNQGTEPTVSVSPGETHKVGSAIKSK